MGRRTAITSFAFGAVEGDGRPNAGVRHVCTRMPSERTREVFCVLRWCWQAFASGIEQRIRRGEGRLRWWDGFSAGSLEVYVISYACPT